MDSDNALERVNYFAGQVLSVSELRAEQEYLLARLRRHSRHLHGWGVVSGLNVTMANSSEIVIEPGVAIDCAGNEIHACSESRLRIPKNLDEYFVAIQYAETEISPVPNLTVAEEPAFTRIREGFRIEIVDVDPTSGHRGKGVGTPGCGHPHQMCIARLKRGRHGWKVDRRGRRRT